MSNVKSDGSDEDLLIQVMLSIRIPLDCTIKINFIKNKRVFDVADGYLLACFDADIDDEVVEKMVKRKPQKVVFLDSGFSNDSVAGNFEHIFK